MISDIVITGAFFVIVIIAVAFGLFALVMNFYVKVEQGKAMIVNTLSSEPEVVFTGRFVYPFVHKAEIMEISVKTIEIDRHGNDGLICADNIRADIKVAFFVRINKTREDVLEVAGTIGCARASDDATLEELFAAKFSEALKTIGKQMEFEDLYRKRDQFRDNIIELIGKNLNGYVLEDAAIDYLEQTPMSKLDANNILDAQGIRKITELTAVQHIHTNELQRDELMKIKKQDVESQEKILELERQEADAEARQQREIITVKAREKAEADKIISEERLKAEYARLETEEKIAVRDENKQREVEVAQKNSERAIVIETEKVERVRQLEAIAREKEVDLQRISKEKALEEQRKEIADVIRTRIVVDKTVAEEEEKIKELRVVAEAQRLKQSAVIAAEAEAEESLVKGVKAAEADEQRAKFKARERVLAAEAELEAAQRQAESQKRLAEGLQAEDAASGLAKAKVQEAMAVAAEKQGLAEARILQGKIEAKAAGEEKHGLAQARIREADAVALQKYGLAEAGVIEEKLKGQARGEEEIGMAQVRIKQADAASEEEQAMVKVRVKIADADATERQGQAEASVIRERFNAEADGLKEKFAAMAAMDEGARGHEEFRMQLEYRQVIAHEFIQANEKIAESHAHVLAKALQEANIDIVGGDGQFLEKFINSIALGKSLDGFLDKSDTAKTVLKDYIDGGGNLLEDVKSILSDSNVSTDAVKNLTLTAFLGKLMNSSDGKTTAKVEELLATAKRLGIDQAGAS